jgi:hypothetical protein
VIAISSHDLRVAMDTSESMYKKLTNMILNRAKDTHKKILKQDLDALERDAERTMDNISQHLPVEKQALIRQELSPFLDRIKSTLRKLDQD